MNAERETTEYRSRTSRLSKWKELVTAAQQELEVPVGVPERLMRLECLICFVASLLNMSFCRGISV